MKKVRTKKERQRVFQHLWADKKLLNAITTDKETIDITINDKNYQVSAEGSEFYVYEY